MKNLKSTTLPEMSEAQFQRLVIDTAKIYGWLVQHARTTRVARPDGSVRHATAISGNVGFPDLVLARNGRLFFIELKVGRNKPTKAQTQWLNQLAGVVGSASDWVSSRDIPTMRGSVTSLVCVAYPRHWEWLREQLRSTRRQ